jgi:transcriptional regulator with XRE-family HTH domain
MPYPFFDIVRIRVTPDEPAEPGPPPFPGGRPNGSKRPHSNAKVAEVRRLIETTTLTYGEISKRSGVGRASICRWARDGAWQRHPFAPRATDTVPTARAGQKLKLRQLAERLRRLAERYISELEEDAAVDADRLLQALQILKMARLEAQGRHRRRREIFDEPRTGHETLSRDEALRAALKEMRRGGVDIDHVPQEAMDVLVDAKMPVEDHPALRARAKKGVARGADQLKA